MEAIISNFTFIKDYEPKIYSKGIEAEKLYCEKHFESAANISRQILELILKLLLSSSPELQKYHSTNLKTCIENLEYIDCCGKKLITTMHQIRMLGNKASHMNVKFDQKEACLCLNKIFDVSIWYLNKKGITTDPKLIFKDPLYQLPETKDIYKTNAVLQLKQSFTNYELTSGQNQLIEKLENFLSYENHDDVFILRGYAGTGKTFIVNGIVKYLNQIRRNHMLMAPTGKASLVLEQRSGVPARTIHSSIYRLSQLKNNSIDNQDNSSVFKLYFSIANNDLESDCVYIVDEASMVSNYRSEQETTVFGSGKLLDDFFQFINFDHNEHHKKVIFIGDSAQLPPIGYDKKIGSPALNKDYLSKTYKLKTDDFELSEVVRQKADSAILKASRGLRNSINKKNYSTINFVFKPRELEKIEINSFINSYTNFLNNKDESKDVIVITRTNEKVQAYNNQIRKIIYSSKIANKVDEILPLQVNERLLCVKNTRQFKNGQIFELCSLIGNSETYKITLNGKNKEKKIRQLTFQNAIVKTENGVLQETKLLLNLLNSDLPSLKPIDQQALYVFFRQRNKNLSPKDPLFKEALLEDPYFNALQVKFGYALTGHKAQGSEWKNVFIDVYSQNKQNEDYFRWLYTAVTRAKKHLIVIGQCNMNVLSNAKIL